MTEKSLLIVDTTLRDGEQRAGLAFSRDRKAICARIMDQLGIRQIEAGIPSMGKSEKAAILAVKENCQNAIVSVWCRMTQGDILDAFDCRPDLIHIGIPVSDIQIKSKLQKNRSYVREEMLRCISLAAESGYMVSLGFEDASRADMRFVASLIKAALPFGIKRIRYADTVGIASPHKVARDIRMFVKTGAEVEMHAHNDLGLAAANTLEAAKSGALYADTTFFGIGERAGNCDLYQLFCAAHGVFNFGFSREEVSEVQREIGSVLGLGGDSFYLLG